MTTDELLQDLSAALADVQPSPAFAVRVRAAVEADSRQIVGVAWRQIFLGGVVTGLATALVTVAVAPRIGKRVPTDAVETRPNMARSLAPASEPIATPKPSGDTRRARSSSAQSAVVTPTVSWVDGHEVIVPADERLALGRLLGKTGGRAAIGPGNFAAFYDKDGLLLPPTPLSMVLLPDLGQEDIDNSGSQTKKPPKDKR